MADTQYRHELKYLISSAQVPILKSRIESFMKPDPHVDDSGSYQIRSFYFDDYYNRCYFENENGTDPREKFRVRIYNHSSQRITLEFKRKERGMTHKTACPLSLKQSELLLRGMPLPNAGNLSPLQRKLNMEICTHMLRPKVIVEYDRIPYVYHEGNVRVTFDSNMASSPDLAAFFSPVLKKRSIMPTGLQLLEVKYDEFLPDFIYQSLNLRQLQQVAYSKYYLCRKYGLPK